MDKKLLPKNFFKNNPLKEISAAKIAHFTMTAGFEERLNDAIMKEAEKGIPQQRLDRIAEERELIAQLDSGEAIVSFMRKKYDVTNRPALCRKALTMQPEVMPLLLHRLRTSLQDEFVEAAACILSNADAEYIAQLKGIYQEIRKPYAQSMACLVFGVRQEEDTLPLLLAEYARFRREDPEERLSQGPLLAIYLLYREA